MAEIRLSPAARQDFLDIGDYTRDRWSEAQAERYLRQILAMIGEIGTYPFLGSEYLHCGLATAADVAAHI